MNDESTYYGDRFFLLRGFFLRFWFRLSYRFLSLLSFGHHWNNCLFWLQGETSKRHAQKACQPHTADHQRNNWWSTSLSHSPLQTSAYKVCKWDCFSGDKRRWRLCRHVWPSVTSRAQPWPIAQTNQSSPPVISQHHHSVFSTTRAIAAARCRRKGRQHGVH